MCKKSQLVRDYEELTKNAFLDEIPDADEEMSEEDKHLARIVGPQKVKLMQKKTVFNARFDCDEDYEGEEE